MAIERLDFENITEADLTELLTAQVPEGLRIEYKQALYGNADADKKELLKDVSAFANAQGGHLVIGIQETGGVPLSMPGVTIVNRDAELLRIDQIIQNGLDPRVRDIRTRSVTLANGNQCVVIRVPKSWQPPHRVILGNSNRFFLRNERNISEPNVQELRTLFTKGSDTLRTAREYRDERVKIISAGQGSWPLASGGRLIMHIMPFAALSSEFQISLDAVYLQREKFTPFGAVGIAPRYNFDGFVIGRSGEVNNGYTQIFRNGIIEVTKAPITRTTSRLVISGIGLERQIFEKLHSYFDGLRAVGVPPPFVVSFVLEGIAGAAYAVNTDSFSDPEPPIDRNVLYLPEGVVENFGEKIDYHRAVKPAFDALWNASEFSSASTFNDSGLWVDITRRTA